MYFTDRGIEELADRRGDEQVSMAWLAERLRDFVDVFPDFETAVDRLASWLARLDEDEDLLFTERAVVPVPADVRSAGSSNRWLRQPYVRQRFPRRVQASVAVPGCSECPGASAGPGARRCRRPEGRGCGNVRQRGVRLSQPRPPGLWRAVSVILVMQGGGCYARPTVMCGGFAATRLPAERGLSRYILTLGR
jgi:hypothetical protein